MEAGPETEHLSIELRRGMITLAVLIQLRSENHGYGVKQALSRLGMSLKEGTLYPMLRRLEAQGALKSRWDTRGDRLRKYYSLSEHGAVMLNAMRKQRALLVQIIEELEKSAFDELICGQTQTQTEME
ncbi:PadR family transcriptional regulator [Dyella subtropica]|uniref:PadR family transcriptional regulator n=1 Tax=Dyella subtropica TaxID=2992127 RepID=UPI0022517432|nr:PadR family transcriptional regulator [Dyella subtropica]